MKTLEQLLQLTIEKDGCLEWTRCLNSDGYPRINWKGNPNGKAHRIVYELATGEDITNLVVRHKCDNPKCINPDHLISGTVSDNMRDRNERGRTFRKMTEHIVSRVRALLATNLLLQKEIADIVGIDPRRVSDIHSGLYDDQGRLARSRQGGL